MSVAPRAIVALDRLRSTSWKAVLRAVVTGSAWLASGLLTSGCLAPAPSAVAPHLRGSVGVPHHGVLTGAASLPNRGVGYERYRTDGVRWGLPRLVATIEHAAREVQRARPGSPALVVGDLSQRTGGKIPRHSSHRTGRDVDLLFFATTARGVPMKSPGFVHYGSDGLGRAKRGERFLRFDVERNWQLVRALIESPHGPPQWIFCSPELEGLLVEHALARGEPPALVEQAVHVLKEPADSLPHDDHFHVRLGCSGDDTVTGCEGGPWWPWWPKRPVLAASDEELLDALLGG